MKSPTGRLAPQSPPEMQTLDTRRTFTVIYCHHRRFPRETFKVVVRAGCPETALFLFINGHCAPLELPLEETFVCAIVEVYKDKVFMTR
jgi:hypothetical protein